MEQLSNAHVHGQAEEMTEAFHGGKIPEFVMAPRPHSGSQHSFPLPAMYVSHAPAMSMEGDGRTVAMNIPPTSLVPVSVPLRQAVMYTGFSNCATVYPTATRGSYSSSTRRQSGGSGEISTVVESAADDGSHDDSPKSGKALQEVCRYFMRTGTCGYGDKCRYHHPQSAHRPKLNSMGYPQREMEHACPFYLKNGWCGFGATCKFNHPELPPLNVPTAATLVPQMLAPVAYSTIPPPPFASVSPGGTYPTVAPAPATPMMHWPVAPAGVPMNVSPPPQSGMYHHQPHPQSYVSLPAVPAWPVSKEQQSMTLGSHGTPTVAQRIYSKPIDGRQEAVMRHTSPKSEDSPFSVVGRDVSLPKHHHHPIGVEMKHALMPMHTIEDASHVSVTTA